MPTHADVVATLRGAGCVFAEDEADLLLAHAAKNSHADLIDLIRQRADGTPLEHLLGWAEFAGRRVAVDPGVFVPRRRTELLAEAAAAELRPGDLAVELCCGSGAIGTVLLAAGAVLHAADIDPVAVACARRNLPGAEVHQGDLYAPLPTAIRGRVRVVVANTPYVPTGDLGTLPPEARLYEPRHSLDGGADGLDIQRRLAAEASAWLAPGGALLVEVGSHQVPEATAVFAAAGLTPAVTSRDESTVLTGRNPTTAQL